MTPQDVLARALAVLGPLTAGDVTGTVSFGVATVDVPRSAWPACAAALRDDPGLDLGWFDFLTAVNDGAEGMDGFEVVLRVVSTGTAAAVLLRTRVPRDDPTVATVSGVYAGALWAERETAEMFGMRFAGHPDPRPLLLADSFDGHPMRRDFVLASRLVQPWPGAHDPRAGTETVAAAGGPARRRALRPPGTPPPEEWLDLPPEGGGPVPGP